VTLDAAVCDAVTAGAPLSRSCWGEIKANVGETMAVLYSNCGVKQIAHFQPLAFRPLLSRHRLTGDASVRRRESRKNAREASAQAETTIAATDSGGHFLRPLDCSRIVIEGSPSHRAL